MPLPSGDGLAEELEGEFSGPGIEEPHPQPEGNEEVSPGIQDEYLPFDIAQVRPSIHDPVDDGKPALVDNEGNVLPQFDERYRDDFNGLTFIGALSKTFTWLGHRFLIRTLTTDEVLQAQILTKEYQDTVGAGLAYRTAVVSLSVQTVDGEPLPVPVVNDGGEMSYAIQRFNHVKARWFPYTIDAVFAEFLTLEERTLKVVEAMGKAFAPST